MASKLLHHAFGERLSEEIKARIIEEALELKCYRAVGRRLNVNYTTVAEVCHDQGIHFEGVKSKTKNSKRIEYDGNVFIWNTHGYYRMASKDRKTLSNAVWEKRNNGEKRPQDMVLVFIDGDKDNVTDENMDFITRSELGSRYLNDHYEECLAGGEKGRRKAIEHKRRSPSFSRAVSAKIVATRHERHPDLYKRIAKIRRENAEARGYWYTEEARKHMSDAHKGGRKKKEQQQLADQMAMLRRKMGM